MRCFPNIINANGHESFTLQILHWRVIGSLSITFPFIIEIFQNVFKILWLLKHEMTITVMKSHYKKQKHKLFCYRKYTHFPSDIFRKELINILSKENFPIFILNAFKTILMDLLDKFAPMKHTRR